MTEHKQSPAEIIASLEKKIAAMEISKSQLVAENTLLRELYERAPLSYQSLDENGCFLSVNQTWVNALGYTSEEVIGRNFSEFLSPNWRDQFKNNFPRFKAIGEIVGVEFEMVKKDGSPILVSVHGTIGKNSQGHFQQTHCIFQDITEFRRVQEEYKLFFDLVPEMVCIASTEGYFRKLNSSWQLTLGYSVEELLTIPFLELVHPDDKQDTIAKVTKQVASEQAVNFINRYRHKDGSYRWFEWHATPNVGKGLLFAVARDITQRKEAEENYQNLFREMLDGFALHEIIYDEEGKPINYRFVDVNPAFERLTGLKAADIVGRSVQEVLPGIEDHWIESYGRVVITGEPAFFESSSGDLKKYFEVKAYRPAPNQFACVFTDISERKKAEEEYKELQVQLQRSQKMEAIGTLAGGIAHDFNNVLAAVIGFGEMARVASPAESDVAGYLDRVLEAGDRAVALVRQILAFSRQDAAAPVPLELAHIIEEAVKFLRPTLPSTISIKQQLNTCTRSIIADPIQIHQIIMNLCTNAFHAMEHLGGTLDIILTDCEITKYDPMLYPAVQPGKFIKLSISDSGSGIPLEIQDKIFDPYFTTKKIGKGTGMGLAIVHGIVTKSGGMITCESETKKGTSFHVFLPAIDGIVADTGISTHIPKRTGKGRILFVDDEVMLVELAQSMLENLGYEVTTHTNSLEALTTFQNQPDYFDAVFTDQTMPNMTGLDLARKMLQIRPDIPIILCTGYSNLVDENLAKSNGIKELAMKPIPFKEIASLLKKVLETKQSS